MTRFLLTLLISIISYLNIFSQSRPPLLPAHNTGNNERELAMDAITFLDKVDITKEGYAALYEQMAGSFVDNFLAQNALLGSGLVLHRSINTLLDPKGNMGYKKNPYHLSAAAAEFYLRGGALSQAADWIESTIYFCKEAGADGLDVWFRNHFNLCTLLFLDKQEMRAISHYMEGIEEMKKFGLDKFSTPTFDALFYCAALIAKDSTPEWLDSTFELLDSKEFSEPSTLTLIYLMQNRYLINNHANPQICLDNFKKLIESNPRIIWNLALPEILTLAREVNVEEYIDLLPEAYYYAQDNIGSTLNAFSIYDTESLWDNYARRLNEVFSLGLNELANEKRALTAAWLNSIFTKHLSILNYRATWDKVRSEGTHEYKDHLSKLISLRKGMAQETDSVKREEIARDADFAEWGLRACLDFQGGLTRKSNEAVLLYHQLPPDECVVEIMEYVRFKGEGNTDRHYGAVICTSKSKQDQIWGIEGRVDDYQFVDLGPVRVWEKYYEGYDNNIDDHIRASYYSTDSKVPFSSLLKNLLEAIKDYKKAYISPVGVFNMVNIGALPYWDPNTDSPEPYTISEKVEIVRVIASTDIVDLKKRGSSLKTAALFSNIDFNQTSSGYLPIPSETSGHRVRLEKGGNPRRFVNLPIDGETLEESVKKAVGKIRHYSGSMASEDNFKSLDGNAPDLIHLDSHGFYLPERNNEFLGKHTVSGTRERALLTCGIPLAGANKAWSGKEIPSGEEDGILMGWEISCMDLSNCKLAVLSACETGKGNNDPVNGVLGLQRALKIAGVQTMLLTLWPVDNELTQEFVNDFYSRLKGSTDFNSAFIATQKEFRRRHPDPYLWAPFILIN